MKFLITGAAGFIGQRVVKQLIEKQIAVIATDVNINNKSIKLFDSFKNEKLNSTILKIEELDISNKIHIDSIISKNNITHIISCGYIMSNIIDNDPIKASETNILGIANLFDSAATNKITRLIFPSSESVYGNTQKIYGNRAVNEEDYCGLQHQSFTYAVMKLLNEFMAQKFVINNNISIACTRPSIVFGYGRKRSSLMWAEEFATLPALGKPVFLPFPEDNKDCWIYVEDCAEQMIQLSLKGKLNYLIYNTGTETVSGSQLSKIVKAFIPEARINFDNKGSYTPFIDYQDDKRIRKEISFQPRTLKEGILKHINEAKKINGLPTI